MTRGLTVAIWGLVPGQRIVAMILPPEGGTNLPDIAIAVIVENAGEGSDYAAPIFRALVETYYYGSWQARPWYASDFGEPTFTPTEFGANATPSR